ncbi:hypothetical protein RRG08_020342 [Elysia crispata]|uniref:Uncharacterized protein n=1 Tax=Elysia crispata TaxID=231223 RepID=A0AAE1AE16_9GAST|nr:hypothetical protein RRG08_020342 [Elysia crispata]
MKYLPEDHFSTQTDDNMLNASLKDPFQALKMAMIVTVKSCPYQFNHAKRRDASPSLVDGSVALIRRRKTFTSQSCLHLSPPYHLRRHRP